MSESAEQYRDHQRTLQVYDGVRYVRVLIHETCGIVNLVMNHKVQILLRSMTFDIRVRELLRHLELLCSVVLRKSSSACMELR